MLFWKGLAVVSGGVLWVFKGSVILLGIGDPGWLVVSSQALLAPAITGLVSPADGRLGAVAVGLAYTAMLLAGFHTVYAFLWDTGDAPLLFNVGTAVGSLGLVGGLICAGVVARRGLLHPPLLRTLPLALGVLFVPVLVAGAAADP